MPYKISKAQSFAGWEVLRFIQGRKKTIITLIATGLGYFLSNNEVIGILSGLIFEGLYAIGEYYFKKVEN